MYLFGYRFFLPVLILVVGIGLVWNCFKALVDQEDVYDRDSANQMFLANIVGIIIGVAMVAGIAWLYLSRT